MMKPSAPALHLRLLPRVVRNSVCPHSGHVPLQPLLRLPRTGAGAAARFQQYPSRATTSGSAPSRRTLHSTARRPNKDGKEPQVGDAFFSVVDNPPTLVRSGRPHNKLGLFLLALIPATALVLGTWQVQRLDWKTKLIARLEDRLVRDPLPLPPRIDPDAVPDFDFRRVLATGRLRHDREMLIGPRMRDGEQGFMVVTPLEREDGASTVLVNRGWISKNMANQRARAPEALPHDLVTVEGLLREPWKKNMFTPDNRPEKGEFYFPDVKEMAALSGSEPVWIESTMEPEYLRCVEMQSKGIPVGRAAEVNLRNNHAQYIFTWYGLAAATSIMLWMLAKKPTSDIARRVRQNKNW